MAAVTEEFSSNGSSATEMAADGRTGASIQIDKIGTERLFVPIIGTSALIIHNWSVKAKRKMLAAQMGQKLPKEPRNPEEEYQSAFYRLPAPEGQERYGFPVLGFKAATVGAARFYGRDVKMTELRQFCFFFGITSELSPMALVEINGTPRMREDVVRLSGQGSTEVRFRPEFPAWTCTLDIRYVTSAMTRSSLLSLIDAGGLGVGVGEWRPEKRGDFGTYQIDQDREVQVISSDG